MRNGIIKLLSDNLSGPMYREPEIRSAHEQDLQTTADNIIASLQAPWSAQEARDAAICSIIRLNLTGPSYAEPALQASHNQDIRETAALIARAYGREIGMEAPSHSNPVSAVTRKMVNQIARAFDGAGQMSYLQRVDVIAKTLGYENQASMMAVLRKAEEAASMPTQTQAPAPIRRPKIEVIMAYGEELSDFVANSEKIRSNCEGVFITRDFNTAEEARSYLLGAEDNDGWSGYTIAACTGVGQLHDEAGDFFLARSENPSLEFRDWHNKVVERNEDLEP